MLRGVARVSGHLSRTGLPQVTGLRFQSGLGGLGRDAVEQFEREIREAEEQVDRNKVLFASASSSDHRPRVAAAEAFDIAAAALPRPPNFLFTVVSADNSTMVDAPEALWKALRHRSTDFPPTMLGTLVKYQRPGNGNLQVLLGCIPDLVAETFTLDFIPPPAELANPAKPPPFVGVSFIDPLLAIEHEALINSHLRTVQHGLGGAPLVGCLCAPLHHQGQQQQEQQRQKGASSTFFFNETVYNGSAAVAVLRSSMVRCDVMSVVPSISIGSGIVTSMQDGPNGTVDISSIDDQPVLHLVKDLYEKHLADKPRSKLYFGIKHGSTTVIPVTFRGSVERGCATLLLPPLLKLSRGDTLQFVVDDDEMDMEAGAALLLHAQKQMGDNIKSVEKSVNVQREARRYVACSTCGGLHFSHPGMNQKATRDDSVNFIEGASLNAPSIMQRCIGGEVPNTGVFTPGQVVTLGGGTGDGDVSYVGTRSSVFALLRGTK